MKTPLPEGSTCQQPHGCEGTGFLTKGEQHSPNLCRICKLVLCDTCAAYVEGIPRQTFMPPALIENQEMSEYASGHLCSDHFNEDWVDKPKEITKAFFHLSFSGFTADQLHQFLKKLSIMADVELDGNFKIEKVQ